MSAVRPCLSLVALAVALSLAAPLTGQTQWAQLGPSPAARQNAAAASGGTFGPAVVFGGNPNLATGPDLGDTWTWNGTGWTPRATTTAPSARDGHAMAGDTGRRRAVLFGGLQTSTNTLVGDTWEWDGTAWAQRTPANAPQARSGHAMAYDAARGRVVLFGGVAPQVRGGPAVAKNDTWEYDGTNWTLRTPTATPSARSRHAMAYDSARQRVVLFGGSSGAAETWEWDGSSWTRRLPAHSPQARAGHALAYDDARQRVVLFGGNNGGGETWLWDGSDWTQATTAATPPGRTAACLLFDGSRTVVFGGLGGSGAALLADTWGFDGSAWTQRPFATVSPPGRRDHAMVYDSARDRVVVFGGIGGPFGTELNDTWEYDGTTWAQRTPGAAPPRARRLHAMAYDSARGRTVLFGGSQNGIRNGETWEWDGTNWLRFFPATNPPVRDGHAMAYDSLRRRVVMFGGNGGGTGVLGDTWQWDGTNWTQMFPATSPPARDSHAMAYDAARGRTFLFGGYNKMIGLGSISDAWEWDGTKWIEVPGGPPGTSNQRIVAMAYDGPRQRVVLVALTAFFGSTYEWDNGWLLRNQSLDPRVGHAMAFDTLRNRVVLFGGTTPEQAFADDTWQYAPTYPATTAPVGSGCPGSNGQPVLTVAPLPWLGVTLFVSVAHGRPNAPAVLLHGLSNATWAGLALPFNLAAQGAPLCTILNSADYARTVMTDAGGFGRALVPVPSDPGLLGLAFYDQFAVFDPAANGFGFSFTASAQSRIGGL